MHCGDQRVMDASPLHVPIWEGGSDAVPHTTVERRCIAKLLIHPFRARITENDYLADTRALRHNVPWSTAPASGG